MSAEEEGKGKGKALKVILAVSVISFFAGSAAGVFGWKTLNPSAAEPEMTKVEKAEKSAKDKSKGKGGEQEDEIVEGELAEYGIGRIVVLVEGKGRGIGARRRLLIDPVIVYDPSAVIKEGEIWAGDKGKKIFEKSDARLRDVYVEYLSLISEDQIRGSYGMSKLRTELLRRTKMVVGDDLPQEVLIRDYMVQ